MSRLNDDEPDLKIFVKIVGLDDKENLSWAEAQEFSFKAPCDIRQMVETVMRKANLTQRYECSDVECPGKATLQFSSEKSLALLEDDAQYVIHLWQIDQELSNLDVSEGSDFSILSTDQSLTKSEGSDSLTNNDQTDKDVVTNEIKSGTEFIVQDDSMTWDNIPMDMTIEEPFAQLQLFDTSDILLPTAKRPKITHSHKLTRKALGNSNINLGNFYDSKTDCFINTEPVPGLPNMLMNSAAGSKTYTSQSLIWSSNGREFVLEDAKACDRFAMLDIDEEQKMSIISGLCSVHGYGEFLTNELADNSESFAIVRVEKSREVTLNLEDEKVVKQIFTIPFHDATHIVNSIEFGVVVACVFTIDKHLDNPNKVKKIILNGLRNNGKLYNDACVDRINARIFVDPSLGLPTQENQQIPLVEAIKSLVDLPKILKTTTEDGLGHPIAYKLLPLDTLVRAEFLGHLNRRPPVIDQTMNGRIAKTIKRVEYLKLQIGILSKFIDDFGYTFSEDEHKEIIEIVESLQIEHSQCRSKCQQILVSIRSDFFDSGDDHTKRLIRIQDDITDLDERCSIGFDRTKQTLLALKKNFKIQIAQYFQNNGVSYIGRGNTGLTDELQKFQTTSCFVYFWTPSPDPDAILNMQLFHQLVDSGDRCIFVDMTLTQAPEIPSQTSLLGKNRIVKYRAGVALINDYLPVYERKRDTCMARVIREAREECLAISSEEEMRDVDKKNLIELEVPCPRSAVFSQWFSGNGVANCPNDDLIWECDECGKTKTVIFDTDGGDMEDETVTDYFYCDCGRISAKNFEFRCRHSEHGDHFFQFPATVLKQVLNRLRTFGEKNILILGETGSGKSTWINSFANYLAHASLEDAILENEPIFLIPSKFTVIDEEHNVRVVKIGEPNARENWDDAESATQMPQAHPFRYKGGKLRLIDTPGIGDTRGSKHDRTNFKNTLRYVGNLRELHGICILLKSNESRLTTQFEYCISELLTHLHRDAAKNIVFCFTNARGTFYRPGGTYDPLKKFLGKLEEKQGVRIPLNKETMYCMDNEAFRFLCAVKSGVQFEDDDVRSFAESWARSEAETNRLIAHMLELQPHKTLETISLNEARRIITNLAKPLAMITNTIKSNIEVINLKQEELDVLDTTDKNFAKKLEIPTKYLASKKLDHPRTVCVDKKCIAFTKDKDNYNQTHFKSHCHPHCYLEGVQKNNYPNPALQNCWAMHTGASGEIVCKVCGCRWDMHMHIRYHQYECHGTIKDPVVQQMLANNKSKKEVLERQKQNNYARISAYEGEQKRINEIAARYGTFLKYNAILPYNDAIEAYIQLEIRKAERIAEETDDYRRVHALRKCLSEYEEQKRIIENYLESGTEAIDPSDINRLFNELTSLPLTGKNIKELFDCEEQADREMRAYAEENLHPKQQIIRKPSRNNFHHGTSRTVFHSASQFGISGADSMRSSYYGTNSMGVNVGSLSSQAPSMPDNSYAQHQHHAGARFELPSFLNPKKMAISTFNYGRKFFSGASTSFSPSAESSRNDDHDEEYF